MATRTALTATKAEFLIVYERELRVRYEWASDAAKLARFVAKARETIEGRINDWNHRGPAVDAAWRQLGGQGSPSLVTLRMLAP